MKYRGYLDGEARFDEDTMEKALKKANKSKFDIKIVEIPDIEPDMVLCLRENPHMVITKITENGAFTKKINCEGEDISTLFAISSLEDAIGSGHYTVLK